MRGVTMKKLISTLVLCIAYTIQAEPYHIQKFYNEAYHKEVILLYDNHYHVADLKNESIDPIMSDSFPELIHLLQNFNTQKNTLDILWESSPAQRKRLSTISKNHNGALCSIIEHMQDIFQNTHVHIIESDMYRNHTQIDMFEDFIQGKKEPSIINDMFSWLLDLNCKKSTVYNDLNNLKHINAHAHAIIASDWMSYSETTIKPFIKKYIDNNAYQTLPTLKKDAQQAWSYMNNFIKNIPNFEVLIKLMSSESPTSIIYFGAGHCYEIAQILEKKLSFKKVFDAGFGSTPELFLFSLQLKPSLTKKIWHNLFNTTKTNTHSYIPTTEMYNQVKMNMNHMQDEPEKILNLIESYKNIGINIVRSMNLLAIKYNCPKTLKAIIKKYPQYTNSFIGNGLSLLMNAIKHNRKNMIPLLMNFNASIAVKNFYHESALDYAKKHNTNMHALLTRYAIKKDNSNHPILLV